MTITFEPVDLPFKVGDTVFVNQPHGGRLPDKSGPQFPYFEAEVVRIFLDGRLEELTVITEPLEVFELVVKTVVYDLKPIGKYSDLVKMPLRLSLPVKEPKLFKSETDLLDYQRTLTQIESEQKLKPSPEVDKPS